MTHAIARFDRIQATDFDSLNRVGVSTVDFDNGWVAQLLTQSSTAGQTEVWSATIPSATSGLKNLWMAKSPAVVEIVSGSNTFKNIDRDVQHFYSIAGEFIDFVKLEIGDLVSLTSDAITGSKASNGYIVATASDYLLNWAASPVSGLTLAYLATKNISKGSGTIGDTQAITAYEFQVTVIA
jgi:hypothetical protein